MKMAKSASDGIVSMIDAIPRIGPRSDTDAVGQDAEHHRDDDREQHRHRHELDVLDHAFEDRRPAFGFGHPRPPARVGVRIEDQGREFADTGDQDVEAFDDVVVGGGVGKEEPPAEHGEERDDDC